MKPIETLEAELWLAQRAHRRNPSDENKTALEAIEAEIEALNGDEKPSTTAETADATVKTQSTKTATAKSVTPDKVADAPAEKQKKETKSKAQDKKKAEQPEPRNQTNPEIEAAQSNQTNQTDSENKSEV